MKSYFYIIFSFIQFYFSVSIHAQTETFQTDSSILFKKYSEVCFPSTHNSFNYLNGPHNYIYPNQRYDIPKQLEDGIRGYMIDIHDQDKLIPLHDEVFVFHEYAILGKEQLAAVLTYFSDFLVAHPKEIITIIFDCTVSDSKKVAEIFEHHPLYNYLYHYQDSIGWLTIEQMIQQNERCVVFSHCNGYSDWYLNQNQYCFENDYNNHEASDYNCRIIRGDTSKDVFIMNHFLYNTFRRKEVNAATNKYPNLMAHIETCKSKTKKYPNFLTVDWYDKGDLFKVVNEINRKQNGQIRN